MQDAVEVVGPVDATDKNDILCSSGPDGVQHSLHSHTLVGVVGCSSICKRMIGKLSTVLPYLPGDIMWLVVEVKHDSRIIGIDRRCGLPKRNAVLIRHLVLADVLSPLAAVRPLQVDVH